MAGTRAETAEEPMKTSILKVDISVVRLSSSSKAGAEDTNTKGHVTIDDSHADAEHLRQAALELKTSDIPVAFPTETVYGLGADATRSSAVQGIYRAKQRPSDNPLIVHVQSVQQLRDLLRPKRHINGSDELSSHDSNHDQHETQHNRLEDPIPSIYTPLVRKFWPGPLTMIMPNPEGSILASEVTAGLSTFGARMPNSPIALALIQLAGVPLAAPSANASTRPSPTTAAHVKHDLDGRIATIIDGGSCRVGVESTVVDGLSDPPAILRPGGISLEELRECEGWENVTIGYRDVAQSEARPRAPGMKYKHYSPKAAVLLYEWTSSRPTREVLLSRVGPQRRIGIVRTLNWPAACELSSTLLDTAPQDGTAKSFIVEDDSGGDVEVLDLDLGQSPEGIARGLFSALRELDAKHVNAIFVEGIDDRQGDVAAAVMNRLRKSAEQAITD